MLETNLVVTQSMDKLCLSLLMLTEFKTAQNYIVCIQIKLVHEILSQDLKPLVRNWGIHGFVGVYMYVHVFVNCGISQ